MTEITEVYKPVRQKDSWIHRISNPCNHGWVHDIQQLHPNDNNRTYAVNSWVFTEWRLFFFQVFCTLENYHHKMQEKQK